MTARALLIGCRLGRLAGVTNNLKLMEKLLSARGFDCRRLEDAAASRQGIIDAFAALAEATQSGDAVAVYFNGHGGLAVDPADPEKKAQFILPGDFLQSAPGDFRGVTSEELSVLLRTLTARTANVSMILDCCHSAQMVRDPSLVPLAMSEVTYVDVAAHNEKVRAFLTRRGLEVDGRDPDAVRLVACDREQSTYEFEERRQIYGMFTFYVERVIRSAASTPLTWGGLVPSVQRSLRLRGHEQRPVVQGESDRLLFSADTVDVTGVLAVTRAAQGRALLDGGRLAGVEVGDRYAVVPTGDPDLGHTIARLTVTAVTATTADADVVLEPGTPELPRSADARVLARAVPAFPVVVGADPALDVVRTALTASPYVRLADDAGEPALARVDLGPAGAARPAVTLSDAVGPATEPTPLDDTGVAVAVRNLERMARAVLVRELDADDPALGLEVTWELVEGATRTPLESTGHTLFVGDEVVVRLRNAGRTTLYASVFGVDAGNAITLLTRYDPDGVALVPGMTWTVPQIGASTLGWSAGVPRSRPRPESLLVVATAEAVDLRMLEQDGVDVPRVRAGAGRLERTIHQIMSGKERDVRAGGVASAVRHVHYLLVDAPRPRRGPRAFLLDELPDVSLALLAAGDTATAATVALIGELTVTPDHPLHGPGLRLDVLVGTLGDDGRPDRAATTVRLPAPPTGQEVTLPAQELHAAPARGLLDLAVWLSRDTAGAPPLAELLDLPTPAVAADQEAAAAAARLDALGVLVDAAQDALGAAAADVTGLYRTTLLASRGFGAGHRPAGLLGADPHITLRLRVDVA